MSETYDYWRDMPLEKFVEGYLEPHLLKCGIEGDIRRAKALGATLACFQYGFLPPRNLIGELQACADERNLEGAYKASQVCLTAALRLETVLEPYCPGIVWVYPAEDEGWCTHPNGDSYPDDRVATKEDAFALARRSYPKAEIRETTMPPYGESPKV